MAEMDNWRQIVQRAWAEPEFKQELLNSPNEILRDYDIRIPEGVTFKVVEDQYQGNRYLVLPPPPDSGLKVDDFGRDAASGDPGF